MRFGSTLLSGGTGQSFPAMDDFERRLQNLIPASDRRLAWFFFVAFSRFEYALKRAGFVRPSHNSVKADWDKFASSWKSGFDPNSTPRLREACDYFEAYPPGKQIICEGELSWKDMPTHGNESLLCGLLRWYAVPATICFMAANSQMVLSVIPFEIRAFSDTHSLFSKRVYRSIEKSAGYGLDGGLHFIRPYLCGCFLVHISINLSFFFIWCLLWWNRPMLLP